MTFRDVTHLKMMRETDNMRETESCSYHSLVNAYRSLKVRTFPEVYHSRHYPLANILSEKKKDKHLVQKRWRCEFLLKASRMLSVKEILQRLTRNFWDKRRLKDKSH